MTPNRDDKGFHCDLKSYGHNYYYRKANQNRLRVVVYKI